MSIRKAPNHVHTLEEQASLTSIHNLAFSKYKVKVSYVGCFLRSHGNKYTSPQSNESRLNPRVSLTTFHYPNVTKWLSSWGLSGV